jgi:hypothetical protein
LIPPVAAIEKRPHFASARFFLRIPVKVPIFLYICKIVVESVASVCPPFSAAIAESAPTSAHDGIAAIFLDDPEFAIWTLPRFHRFHISEDEFIRFCFVMRVQTVVVLVCIVAEAVASPWHSSQDTHDVTFIGHNPTFWTG